MDILEEIVAHKRIEIEQQKAIIPPATLYANVEQLLADGPQPHRSMKESLANSTSGIIAEFKRKSPSKGWIKEEGKPDVIPASYSQNGASAISILTDEKYFGGILRYIRIARPTVTCPILRKDFIVDEYQLYQAKMVGADAVLLIAADLTKEECQNLAKKAHKLQLETLLEVHTEAELEYLNDCIDMLGVNNRNLGTFHTDVANSYRLADKLRATVGSVCGCTTATKGPLLVSESGISNPQTVRELREAGFRGFLIGETFMKTADPGQALADFIAQVIQPTLSIH
ncbi:MAG: indole-3-glycerol phosphate synthase TrpC [Bacteroidaceae bacterium]|nr:indole-3-glycerol phosphate synthase TrpC [Bacteroidaceae bacterium]